MKRILQLVAIIVAVGSSAAFAIARQPSDDAAIYHTLFAKIYGDKIPVIVWVADSTPRIDVDGYGRHAVAAVLSQANEIPPGLKFTLDSLITTRQSTEGFTLPDEAQIASKAVVDSLAAMKRVSNGPRTAGLFTISRIAYVWDHSQALVLYGWGYCGGRCAEWGVASLLRNPSDHTWKIDRVFTLGRS